ncbi:MAG: amidohydrolase family protein [Gemmatimonadaceae bacterium]
MRVISAVLLISCTLPATVASQSAIAFTNGRWFNGQGFEQRVMYAVNGVFQTQRPAAVDTMLDLQGGYVVPPFGEAHNHNIEGSSRTDVTLARYVAEGIFYVLNPNNLPRSVIILAGRINEPNAVDVIFAHGGLNVTGGHPYDLVQRNIGRGSWQTDDGEGAFYHTIADRAALDAKWPKIIAGKPDFIKIYLLYSNEYEERRQDTTARGVKGLDPSIVPDVVRRAHDAGLRVGAHIENVADFRTAVAAGVDIIMHMPGYGWRGSGDSAQHVLSDADANAAARRGTSVVTTLAFGQRASAPQKTPLQARRDALNAANLRTLKAAGVVIAVGSDNYGATSRSEVLYLSDLAVFTNLELLKLCTEATPVLIFPKRKIGALRTGYEASFVVLEQDPLQDFANVQRVVRRVKQGHLLP